MEKLKRLVKRGPGKRNKSQKKKNAIDFTKKKCYGGGGGGKKTGWFQGREDYATRPQSLLGKRNGMRGTEVEKKKWFGGRSRKFFFKKPESEGKREQSRVIKGGENRLGGRAKGKVGGGGGLEKSR